MKRTQVKRHDKKMGGKRRQTRRYRRRQQKGGKLFKIEDGKTIILTGPKKTPDKDIQKIQDLDNTIRSKNGINIYRIKIPQDIVPDDSDNDNDNDNDKKMRDILPGLNNEYFIILDMDVSSNLFSSFVSIMPIMPVDKIEQIAIDICSIYGINKGSYPKFYNNLYNNLKNFSPISKIVLYRHFIYVIQEGYIFDDTDFLKDPITFVIENYNQNFMKEIWIGTMKVDDPTYGEYYTYKNKYYHPDNVEYYKYSPKEYNKNNERDRIVKNPNDIIPGETYQKLIYKFKTDSSFKTNILKFYQKLED
jgi:hypothetical protein